MVEVAVLGLVLGLPSLVRLAYARGVPLVGYEILADENGVGTRLLLAMTAFVPDEPVGAWGVSLEAMPESSGDSDHETTVPSEAVEVHFLIGL